MSGKDPTPPVAMVTGGARRLGRRICEVLSEAGYRVVVGYRTSTADADRLVGALQAKGRYARALALDVSREQEVAAAFATVEQVEGRLDLLVNNVGNYNPQPIEQLEPCHWDATIQTNLSGTFYCCYHALRRMGRGGHIINIGTAGLHGCGADKSGLDYYVSKSGLLVLTRSLAKTYAARGIRVNMVSPGMLKNSVDFPDDIASWVPMGYGGDLDDITQAVAYLLAASYVTGVNIDIAGGYRL